MHRRSRLIRMAVVLYPGDYPCRERSGGMIMTAKRVQLVTVLP